MQHFTRLFLFIITIFIYAFSFAQNKSKWYYKKNPAWIEMIKAQNVNYYEALKAYNLFWSNKKKPEVEHDMIGQNKNNIGEKEHEVLSKKERKMYNLYALEIKKFEAWQRKVLPFVQEDGRILTNDEKLKLWEDSKK